MLETVMMILHGACVMYFGIALSASFSGIRFTKRNVMVMLGLGLFCGALQLLFFGIAGADLVWKIYPVITHIPVILLIWKAYHKYLATSIAAVFTSYLCCQPANWVGVLVRELGASAVMEYGVQIFALNTIAAGVLVYIGPYISNIFTKSRSSVMFFGSIPTVYYLFDYITSVYTDLWINYNRAVSEFLPMLIMLVYLVFCIVYMKLTEEKDDALRKEQIIQLTLAQKEKEIHAVRQNEHELRLLRHDMRLILSSLAVSIENGETDNALRLIEQFTDHIEQTRLQRYCNNETINYVLSDYAERCKAENVDFRVAVELDALEIDELMFSSILSNALDNALNAQLLLPKERRSVRATLKETDGRLLLSVKNPVGRKVVFSDGLPVSRKRGHGYGTQSIRYLTERLGGNCQFSVQDGTFILRVII